MAEESTRRVELVAESNKSNTREAACTGIGLMVGLFLGRNSLMAAATGSEQFEFAIAHFVGLVLASVAGSLLLGTLYERASRAAEKAAEAELADEEEITEEIDTEEVPVSPELPIGMPT